MCCEGEQYGTSAESCQEGEMTAPFRNPPLSILGKGIISVTQASSGVTGKKPIGHGVFGEGL